MSQNKKRFLQDEHGNLSMMRLSHLICMVSSSCLLVAGIAGLFMDKDISTFLTSAVAFATIGTAGKYGQIRHEK